MQPISVCRTSSSTGFDDGLDPPEVFCKIGSLIVEGRLPKDGDERGFGEGPHVPPAGNVNAASRHACNQDSYMCKKDENFRRHMLLLWQNNVPVSIEVLLSPDCRLGRQKARSIEFSTVPEPGSILLEKWTVSVEDLRPNENLITSRGLFQAVRSYLHFSQISAWLSSSKGQTPKNLLFRITVPGEAFASKFTCTPEEHYFPPAGVSGSSIHVSVRALPRCDRIPTAVCGHTLTSPTSNSNSSNASGIEETEESKLAMAGALTWKEIHDSETDLRRALVRARLAECQAAGILDEQLPRSDSMDSMLGDSLLDPPQCLQKIVPKRYQSPSRCGSPSMETPEHLLFGKKRIASDQTMCASNPSSNGTERLARQDLIRRRDMSLYYGLHPKLIHSGENPPRLSLPLKSQDSPEESGPSKMPTCKPIRVYTPGSRKHGVPLDDRMQIRCNISGKHNCSLEDEEAAQQSKGRQSNSNWIHEYKKPKKSLEESGIVRDIYEAQFDEELPMKIKLFKSSPFGSRRSSLKENDTMTWKDDDILSWNDEDNLSFEDGDSLTCSPDREGHGKNKGISLNNIFDDGSGRPAPLGHVNNLVTQVYRAETQRKRNSLLDSIFRNSKNDQRKENCPDFLDNLASEQHPERKTVTAEINLVNRKARPDSISNGYNSNNNNNNLNSMKKKSEEDFHLEPLDLSFDEGHESGSRRYEEDNDDFEWQFRKLTTGEPGSEDEEEDEDDEGKVTPTPSVPSSVEMDSFRKSFDSAASMVFHRRTGLPLTSSPAPLRRGKDHFDFDDSLISPNDIKRALFRAESQKQPSKPSVKSTSSRRKRDDASRRSGNHTTFENTHNKQSNNNYGSKNGRLSVSAPATVTTSNLLGSFEESVLNGRLDPVSTVAGFTAEIGASGSFHPKHKTLPVTVFFYTLGDNNTISSPYLGHINLGKKGYRVPEKGTIQVTLFNPLGTVVKMFVVMYNLSDMPPNSQTFLRQRTLYMPSGAEEPNDQKWLRYLIHLRFASSKSGKIYLHTDIRMIIFRKSDLDTATDHAPGKGFELRSFTRGPTNPKFSARK